MPASKNGIWIYIDGTGNTPASVYADIANPAYVSNPSPGVYQIEAGQYVAIRSGGVLTIGNPLDYSTSDTLQFNQAAHWDSRFYIYHGGELQMYGAAVLDCSVTSMYMYFYHYGKSIIQGDTTYRPKIDHINSIYMYFTSTNPADYTHDTHVWDRFDFVGLGGSSVVFYVNMWTVPVGCSITNFTIDCGGGYGIRSDNYQGQGYRITVSDGVVSNGGSYGCLQYCINDFVLDNVSISASGTNAYTTPERPPRIHKGVGQVSGNEVGIEGQDFLFFTDCTFTGGTFGINAYSGVVVLEGCTFTGSTYGIYCYQHSRIYLRTGNSIGGTNPLAKQYYALIAYVFGLDLTIEDEVGSPIEGAIVKIQQRDEREVIIFRTDASGKLITHPLMSGEVLLVHKEWLSGDPVTGTFEFWSDSSNSTCHEVEVAKDGYVTQKKVYVMDQDLVDTVALALPSAGSAGFVQNRGVYRPVGRERLMR